MIEFDTTVRIGRTPGQVFPVLADFGTYLARWAKGPVAAVRTDGDGGVAITPNGNDVYVTNADAGTVSAIGTATNTVFKTITVGSGPRAAAVGPLGKALYVANAADGTVSVILTATNTVTATIHGFSQPWDVAITPDGNDAYVTNAETGYSTVSEISTASYTITATATGFNGPFGVAINSHQQNG
jgi:YVTN family beta-propeller protein